MNPLPVELRHAVASDLDAILSLERATDNAPHWPPSTYAAMLDSNVPARCLIVAHRNGGLAGFAVGLLHRDERLAELESVAVTTDARRTGIGRDLCGAVIDWGRSGGATEVVLEVRASSIGAIALYNTLGFIQTGRRPGYYHDPEDDALVMRLKLAEPS
jgi:ribosomal-protein-alanine N-acetyltransferase